MIRGATLLANTSEIGFFFFFVLKYWQLLFKRAGLCSTACSGFPPMQAKENYARPCGTHAH